jgi:hypothetical protein
MERFDLLGDPVSVNYKGKTTYKTPCGAFMSILCTVWVLMFALMKITVLVQKLDPKI